MLYAEDHTPGRTFDLGERTLSAEEIVAFAREWDPQPFHLDAEAARVSPIGGLFASGLHGVAVLVRLGSDGMIGQTAIVAGRGWHDVQMRKPIRPGMRLRGTATVVEQTLRESDGVIHWRLELHGDGGELVLGFTGEGQVLRRQAANDSSASSSPSGASNIG
jgi:acyl dehydratase